MAASSPLWSEAATIEWKEFQPNVANRCTLAILIIIGLGYVFQQPAYGIVAAGGALSVGFGVYHQFTSMRIAPMVLATIGMALSAMAGSILGNNDSSYIALAALWGLLPGIGAALGSGAWWITVQWAIAMLVAGAYPSGPEAAVLRGILVLLGGGLQIVIAGIAWPARMELLDVNALPSRATLASTFAIGIAQRSTWLFAVRGAITLVSASMLYRFLEIPNGYWIGVTAIITLKPEFRETLARSLGRSGGTLIGAGLATLLIALLRPGPETMLALTIAFAWLSYAILRVNYALFAVALTAYIVFLIGLAHLPPLEAVQHRLLATAIGGALAMVAHIHPVPIFSKHRDQLPPRF